LIFTPPKAGANDCTGFRPCRTAEKPGKVIMQTRQPEHPLLTTLIRKVIAALPNSVGERKDALLPPFSYQALLRVQAGDVDAPQIFFRQLPVGAGTQYGHTQILGPVSAPMARRAGLYRYQLLFQNTVVKSCMCCLKFNTGNCQTQTGKKVRWSLDLIRWICIDIV